MTWQKVWILAAFFCHFWPLPFCFLFRCTFMTERFCLLSEVILLITSFHCRMFRFHSEFSLSVLFQQYLTSLLPGVSCILPSIRSPIICYISLFLSSLSPLVSHIPCIWKLSLPCFIVSCTSWYFMLQTKSLNDQPALFGGRKNSTIRPIIPPPLCYGWICIVLKTKTLRGWKKFCGETDTRRDGHLSPHVGHSSLPHHGCICSGRRTRKKIFFHPWLVPPQRRCLRVHLSI